MILNASAFFLIFFLTVQKKQVVTSKLLWPWDLSRNKNQLFFEKILQANKLKVKTASLNVPDLLQKTTHQNLKKSSCDFESS